MIHFKPCILIAVCVSALSLTGCVEDNKGSAAVGVSADNVDFVSLTANYADAIIIPNYQALLQSATALVTDNNALAGYCTALGTAGETAAQSQLIVAWNDLQSAIQRSETHILGPVTDNGGALLNRLNAYNSAELSTCGIDQAVVLSDQDNAFDITSRTTNQRGIGTLEYLLFNQDLTHTCPIQVLETINWNSRSIAERKQLRCSYAIEVAQDIANAANQLLNAWLVNEGNYRASFINPNNTAASLEALSDAMFYLDVDVKDRKLGIPTGINNEGCANISCPDQVESPYSETSLANIRQNLEGFRVMLTGADGLGFDDIISQAGVSDLNTRMLGNIDTAINMIAQSSDSLRNQVANILTVDDEAACSNAFANPSAVSSFQACTLYGVIKLVTNDLKVDFVAAVNVDLPERGQADND